MFIKSLFRNYKYIIYTIYVDAIYLIYNTLKDVNK